MEGDGGVKVYGNTCVSGSQQWAQRASKSSGQGFLDEMKKAAVTDAAGSKGIYEQLSGMSKNVLERIKNGYNNITKVEWMQLCTELKDMGAMTETEFKDIHLIPLGYTRPDGVFVMYEHGPSLFARQNDLSQWTGVTSNSTSGFWSFDDWSGDPLKYLDDWISSLRSWRDDLATKRNPDGSPKYENFGPIENKLNACQKVEELLKELMNQ